LRIGKCDILRAFDSMDVYGGGVDDEPAEGEPTPPVVRASDAERNLVAERLGTACGEGRLTLTEFSDRVGEVYAARTRAELDRLVTALPVAAERLIASVADGVKATRWEVHPLGGVRRTGRWRVPPREVFVTLLGGMHLDLRDAVLGAEEVSLTVVALLGGVRTIVPPGVEVDVDGLTLLGGRHVEVDPNPPRAGNNAPRLPGRRGRRGRAHPARWPPCRSRPEPTPSGEQRTTSADPHCGSPRWCARQHRGHGGGLAPQAGWSGPPRVATAAPPAPVGRSVCGTQ